MELFFDVNQPLLENLYGSYSKNAHLLISKIPQNKKLSQFDRFNKRFKISWGIKIEFTDDLAIAKEDTRACYALMLKISDLWFAFEHLMNTASEVIPRDANPQSKVDFYRSNTLESLGFNVITSSFNQLFYQNILCKNLWRREVHHLLEYLGSNTRGGVRKIILEIASLVKEKKELQAKHIFSLAYGIRNIYVHQGVAAALGGSSYPAKRALYSVLYDALVLYSLALGDAYCRKELANY